MAFHFHIFARDQVVIDERRRAVDRGRAMDKGDGMVKEREERGMKRTKCPSALLAEADGSSKKEKSK